MVVSTSKMYLMTNNPQEKQMNTYSLILDINHPKNKFFAVRIEDANGNVDFVDLPKVVSLPHARTMAVTMGYPSNLPLKIVNLK